MAQPTSKMQLLTEAEEEREKLLTYLCTLSLAQKTQPGILGDWSVKDVLGHLIEWHQMVLSWVAAGQRGETPAVPAEGYNWGMLPALNQKIYEKHCSRPLEEIEEHFLRSDQQVRDVINGLDEADLLKPGLYRWMNKNPLSAYFNSNMTAHYRWALKEIRRGIKASQK